MMGLSDGRKSFPIGLAVLIQYRSVTASHPASQPAIHVAVAITLNAKASSLKTVLTERTDRAWFSRLLQHPARKWSGSILTIPEHARGASEMKFEAQNLHAGTFRCLSTG